MRRSLLVRDDALWTKPSVAVCPVTMPDIAYQAAIIDAVRTEPSVTVDVDSAGPGVGSHVGLHDLVGGLLGATLWAQRFGRVRRRRC